MKLKAPRASSLGAGALIIAGLATTQALNAVMPAVGDNVPGTGGQRPFTRTAPVGSTVELRAGTIKILSAQTTRRIARPASSVVTSSGTFIVVQVEWTSKDTTNLIANAQLIDGLGRTFERSNLGVTRDGVLCPATPPGLTSDCAVVLEVPDDAVTGAEVRIGPAGQFMAFDDIAVVPLASAPGAAVPATDDSPVVVLTVGIKGLP